MPTCTNKHKRVGTHLIDSDIAQLQGTVEKNKEEAYFNSYDFDGISLKSHNEEIDVRSHRDRSLCTCANYTTADAADCGCSSRRIKNDLHSDKRELLKKQNNCRLQNGDIAGGEAAAHFNLKIDETTGQQQKSRSASELNGGGQHDPAGHRGKTNQFLLPRAMLKYQNSCFPPMPLAIIENSSQTSSSRSHTPGTVTTVPSLDHSNAVNETTTTSPINPVGQSGFVSSSSASSLSAASISSLLAAVAIVEDSIATPTGMMGVVGVRKPTPSAGSKKFSSTSSSSLPMAATHPTHYSTGGKSAAGSSGYYSSNVCSTYSVEEHIYCEPVIEIAPSRLKMAAAKMGHDDRLHVLESSIANLDKHLRSYPPSMGTQQQQQHHLPTIMEGIDHSLGMIKSKSSPTASTTWHDDAMTMVDDSLADIDLDSFLLNGVPRSASAAEHATVVIKSDDELEENDYKCAKYIASCPEDAYRIETDFVASCEDQLHFQMTRRMLEDVHDQILAFTDAARADDDEVLIDGNLGDTIERLQFELKTHIEVMNRNSELEIRQLCTGLVNNEKIVKLTNAFERQRSYGNSAIYGDGGATIRCSTDPNFQMKHKRIGAVFPGADVDFKTKPTAICDEDDNASVLEWHRNKPSIWQMYYGTNRKNHSLLGKRGSLAKDSHAIISYPSSRPESDFTLDVPRAEQLRQKLEKEKKFRQRCRMLTTFLSLIFFLLTVMIVSLILTRGKRMFGSITW